MSITVATRTPTIESVTVTTDSLTSHGLRPTTHRMSRATTSGTGPTPTGTVREGVWISGSLTYTLDGLSEGTAYEVQVRAVAGDDTGEWSATHTATTSDHGNTDSTATRLTLGSSVNGRIGANGDVDVFSIELEKDVAVWVYTTGDIDTKGS